MPCARKSNWPSVRARSSNTSMKVRPMSFRFSSGSVTPARRSRNRSRGVHGDHGQAQLSAKRATTCCASSCRSRPLSTKMHVRRSPMARCSRTAATVESTPPLSAHTTRPVPDLLPDARDGLVHERGHRPVAAAAADVEGEAAAGSRRRRRCAPPRVEQEAVEPRRLRSSMAATGALALVAADREAVRAPPPRSRRGSPTRAGWSGSPSNSAPGRCRPRPARARTRAADAGPTRPPSVAVISCMP